METQAFAENLVVSVQPIIVLLVAGIIGLWLKDFMTSLVASLKWKMKPGFEPGDTVFLDGESAVIISIGYRETVFEIDNGRGKVWRYIENTRIPTHRLEQIITKKEK